MNDMQKANVVISTASFDNTARFWDLEKRCLQVIEGHAGWVVSAIIVR